MPSARARTGNTTIKKAYGNLTGLKPSQLDRIERLYRRKISAEEVLTQEVANYLAELSFETARQIGMLINRKGVVEFVVVGDHRDDARAQNGQEHQEPLPSAAEPVEQLADPIH